MKVRDIASELKLHTAKQRTLLSLADAVVDNLPTITLTMDGAATLELSVQDAERKLLRDPVVRQRSWAEVQGVRFELVRLRKAGNRVTLEFEDGIIAALRREKSPLSIPAGTQTRAAIVKRMAAQSRVPVLVDDSEKAKVRNAVERSANGTEKSNSWDVLGELAEARQWRRFSDGKRLVVGPDSWLLGRGTPRRVKEYTGAVHDIDFDLDVGRRASTATVNVDIADYGVLPGAPIILGEDMGPAQGQWLVQEVRWSLTATRGTLTLTRGRHELEEPKKESGAGDKGDPNYVPTDEGSAEGATSNGKRAAMVDFALRQRGKAYVWGGNGPDGYDCSGLVQVAVASAGGPALPKPSAGQWSRCVAANKTVPISTALRTRGALLFRIGGEFNHVAISLGNGSTIEARGTGYGVNVFGNASGQGWTGAALWL